MNNQHYNVSFNSRGAFIADKLLTTAGDSLIICNSDEDARNLHLQLKTYKPELSTLLFPAWDTVPYDRASPSGNILSERAKILSILTNNYASKILITSCGAILQKIPHQEYFKSSMLSLKKQDLISQEQILEFLVRNSFRKEETAEEPGEFAVRGEIIDFVRNYDEAYRIVFYCDHIESIKKLDPLTQVSIKSIDELEICPSSELLFDAEKIKIFRDNFLKQFGANHIKNPLYESIINGLKPSAIEHLLPLFYYKMTSIFDYLKNPQVIYDDFLNLALDEKWQSIEDFYQARQQMQSEFNHSYLTLKPEQIWLSKSEIHTEIQRINSYVFASGNHSTYHNLPNLQNQSDLEKKPVIEVLLDYLKQNQKLIITAKSTGGLERVRKILTNYDIKFHEINSIHEAKTNICSLMIAKINAGFVANDTVLVTDQDLFGNNLVSRPSSSKKFKNIINNIEGLKLGELIVHQDHGIGRFDGTEIIDAADKKHDCIKLTYAGNDRLYLPVENIDLIYRYGEEEVALDRLGNVGWQGRKAKLKNRIGQIAQELIRIAAIREATKIEPLELNSSLYDKFCQRFPFQETEDQQNAINDILEDFRQSFPTDRLICGDVGFGKTEVAMRAAFMIATGDFQGKRKQVAIIAPTTILARQHYANFIQRFSGFNLQIKQISRLVKSSEIQKTKQGLKEGNVDIVIGTHALLASDINFADLGLLIVDEEQHFGVVQKDKIKRLKESVHVLSLSATPIPRTLQMAILGIKSLSLITTPPIDRLPIHTIITPHDHVIIKDALMKEHFRGGRSFYVAPRINDLQDIQKFLDQYVPELTYCIAHGQMPAANIDKIMNDFYDGKFDILLSTTIIESGIDIPTANTMIIHKANNLGLSQLYQLRGRVGRSKIRGNAYLIIESKKAITEDSKKRLQALQMADTLGAGFSVASQDMDIRGYGNLVGTEQSGNIREVGVELYQEMIKEELEKIRQEQNEDNDNKITVTPTLNLGIPIFIPEEYVSDSNQRIKLYQRIARLESDSEAEQFKIELIDRFGSIPESVENLFEIIKIKQICKMLCIKKVDVGNNGIVLSFTDLSQNFSDKIIHFISQNPRNTKLKPDNKLVIITDTQKHNIIDYINNILEKIKLI